MPQLLFERIVPLPTNEKPIGGLNAIVDTLEEEPQEIQREEIFTVFELITDGEALVNLVRQGYIGIKDIRLITFDEEERQSGNDADYAAIISMENLTDRDIDYVVPKGQVFENREPRSGRQNLTAAKEERLRIKAGTSYELKVKAHCMNKELSGPNGSPGNITIFKIRNNNFKGQEDLWESVQENIKKAKLVVEGKRQA